MSLTNELISIIDNNSQLYKQGKFEVLDESEYMHPTVSDSVISVNDVNSVEHKLGVRVSSKNLCNKEYLGDINNWSKLNTNYYHIPIYVGKGNTKITVSYSNVLETGLGLFVGIKTLDDTASESGLTYLYHNTNSSLIRNTATLKIAEDAEYAYIRLNMTSTNVSQVQNFMYYIGNDLQIEVGSTKTDYTPYISDFSNVSVRRCGKNLFDISKITNTSKITVNPDGTVTVAGSTYSTSTGIPLKTLCPSLKVGDTVVMSMKTNGSALLGVGGAIWKSGDSKTITETRLTKSVSLYGLASEANEDYVNPHTIEYIQFEYGTTATDYEPYKEVQTLSADNEGVVNDLTSVSPNMSLSPDTSDVTLEVDYYRDIDTYIDNLIEDVALSGGE